ncbi:MAG: hypothetical protein RR209_02395, partial [Angelakisella sp.]
MKKKLYRMMSALCALVLMVQTMAVTTGFAAADTSIKVIKGQTATGLVAPNADIFFYDLSADTTVQESLTTIVANFSNSADWIVLKKPTMLLAPGISTVTNSTDTLVQLNSTTVLTVTGDKDSAKVAERIVPETTAFVTKITPTSATTEKG